MSEEQIARPRRRRKNSSGMGQTESRLYFNYETQEAIVKFQTLVDKRQREDLYVNTILPAFKKLVENLINIHKFVGLHDSYDDLKNDCVNFLFETIIKFDSTRGTNAFSYFNVVAKNWLIIRTKQKSNYVKKNISLDDTDSMSNSDIELIEGHNSSQSNDSILENFKNPEETIRLLHKIRNELRSETELLTINSVITIFENIDDIDFLNKSAVMLYMRELSGLNPKQLTNCLQNIKKHYKMIKKEIELDEEIIFDGRD